MRSGRRGGQDGDGSSSVIVIVAAALMDAANEEEFNDAIDYFKSHALYDTGVTAEYGDKLITLVTCSYHVDNGRFIVVAKETALS